MHRFYLFAFLLLLPSAHAMTACKIPSNDFNGLRCLSKLYQETDIALNSSYIELVGKLDLESKATLKESQLNWIRQRDNQCGAGKSYRFLVDMDCSIKITKERTNHLQSLHRKCNGYDCRWNAASLAKENSPELIFLKGFLNAINVRDATRFIQHMESTYINEQLYGVYKGDLMEFLDYFFWGRNIETDKYSNIPFGLISKVELVSYEPISAHDSVFKVTILVSWDGGQVECLFYMTRNPESDTLAIVGNVG